MGREAVCAQKEVGQGGDLTTEEKTRGTAAATLDSPVLTVRTGLKKKKRQQHLSNS